MAEEWMPIALGTLDDVWRTLVDLQAKGWLCRGHSRFRGGLIPSIDRGPRECLARAEKVRLERQSIDLFRSTARFFADPGEQGAMFDDFITLMVLRHYGVPPRLLDWSASPYVATYFAVGDDDQHDGELWAFDRPTYEQVGKSQWLRWPQTTTDRSGKDDKFDAKLTAFLIKEPPDWFIAAWYPQGFPRQNAQQGWYTATARFGVDHANAIDELLADASHRQRYVFRSELKAGLRTALREQHGIWRGSLFPDSAGAADTAHELFRARGV